MDNVYYFNDVFAIPNTNKVSYRIAYRKYLGDGNWEDLKFATLSQSGEGYSTLIDGFCVKFVRSKKFKYDGDNAKLKGWYYQIDCINADEFFEKTNYVFVGMS